MAYAQINYPTTKLGFCGVTIAQSGCFLTAFSNLEARFGRPINPINLNTIFKNKNVYINYCDLYWSAITKYDSRTLLVKTGAGKPTSNNSIVQFIYNGGRSMHFALVHDAAKGLIVDSWDGVVRHWDYYGGPDAYATYSNKPIVTPPSTQFGRVVGSVGVNYRAGATTASAIIKTFKPGEVLTFKGYVTGQSIAGNNRWYVGYYTGKYCWSGAFTNSSVAGIKKLN